MMSNSLPVGNTGELSQKIEQMETYSRQLNIWGAELLLHSKHVQD